MTAWVLRCNFFIRVLTKLHEKTQEYIISYCAVVWLCILLLHEALSQPTSPSVSLVTFSCCSRSRGHMLTPPPSLSLFPSLSCYLQRPAPWTTAAATGHVKTRPLGCAAAALWDSPCNPTAKPAKVSRYKCGNIQYVCETCEPALRVNGARLLFTVYAPEPAMTGIWVIQSQTRPRHPLHLQPHAALATVTATACYCWFCRWAFLHFRQPAGDVNDGGPRRRPPQRGHKHPKHIIVVFWLSSKQTASLNDAGLWVQAESLAFTGSDASFSSGLDKAAMRVLWVGRRRHSVLEFGHMYEEMWYILPATFTYFQVCSKTIVTCP